METAPRIDTSSSGSSFEASSDAEYTDAPASLTIIFCAVSSLLFLSISPTSLSVSREPVPLPMLIKSTLYCLHSVVSVRIDLSHWFCGACGNMVLVATTLPVLSTTATLTPVLKPGSRPIVVFAPAGAAISRSFRFLANTSMASSSARSRSALKSSVSMCRPILIFHVHCTTWAKKSSAPRPRCIIS